MSHPVVFTFIKRLTGLIICSLLYLCSASASQTDSLRISLITCDAGPEIYELCGHAAIRVQNSTGLDYVIHYGLFDFDSPNFLYRFVKGETDYMAGAQPTDPFLRSYARQGRKVTEYPLNITPAQASKLEHMLMVNLRPENRSYRYNYIKDNCATRPLNMIEAAIGDTIMFNKEPALTENWTFRDEMRHCHGNYPWYQLGIDLALGSGLDYAISTREKAFAPIILSQLITHATIRDSLGSARPLIASEPTILVNGTADKAIKGPTPWYLSPVCVFWVICALTLAISIRDIFKHDQSRWFDTIVYGTYGIAGMVVAFLVLCSEHEATSPNWLIIGLNPFCLIGAILPWITKLRNVLYYYHTANFIILFILVCAWSLTGQDYNPAFLPLALIDMMRSDTYRLIWKCKNRKDIIIPQK